MTYLHRNEVGHLVAVQTPPPTPERAIMDAHRQVIAGPVPDSWQAALAALTDAALAARCAALGWRLDGLVLYGNGEPAAFGSTASLAAWVEKQEQATKRSKQRGV